MSWSAHFRPGQNPSAARRRWLAVAVGVGLGLAVAGHAAAKDPLRERRLMLGIDGHGLQIPVLRPRVTTLDRRYLGNTVTLGGVGVFGRWQAVPLIGFELGVRTGSLRYHSSRDVISQDIVLAELGVLLYVLRGQVGHVALDAGGGGLVHAIRYELAGPNGSQVVGAGLFRVGLNLELRLRRIAFIATLRSYGVITDLARTRTRGELFEDASPSLRQAPLARYQTYVLGSLGVAYRF